MKCQFKWIVLLPEGGFKSQSVIGLKNGNGQPEFLSSYEGQSPLQTHIRHIFLVCLLLGLFLYEHYIAYSDCYSFL